MPEEMLLHIILLRQRPRLWAYHARTSCCNILPQVLTKKKEALRDIILATDMFLHLGRRLSLTVQTAMPPATARESIN